MQDDRLTTMPLDPALARSFAPEQLPPIDPDSASILSWRCPAPLHERITIVRTLIASVDRLAAQHLGATKPPTFCDLSGAALAVGVVMAWPLGFVTPAAPAKTTRSTTRFLSQWLRVATCARMHDQPPLTIETLPTATDTGVVDHPRLCAYISIGLDAIEDELAHLSPTGARSLAHPTAGLFGRLGMLPALQAVSKLV